MNKPNTAIVMGSSRSKGNTFVVANQLALEVNADLYDLNQFQIMPFDYDNQYQDDFQSLIDTLLSYDNWVFASPMYWYSASAQMKVFLDRLSDLLSFNKDKGRSLRGKSATLLATGNDLTPPSCFEDMFRLTFNYLGMEYYGMYYLKCDFEVQPSPQQIQLNNFVERLK